MGKFGVLSPRFGFCYKFDDVFYKDAKPSENENSITDPIPNHKFIFDLKVLIETAMRCNKKPFYTIFLFLFP